MNHPIIARHRKLIVAVLGLAALVFGEDAIPADQLGQAIVGVLVAAGVYQVSNEEV